MNVFFIFFSFFFLTGYYVGFGEETQSQNFHIYNINMLIIQTHNIFYNCINKKIVFKAR